MKRAWLMIFSLLSLALFENCGGFSPLESGHTRVASYTFNQMSDVPLEPTTDHNDSACMTKSDFDACLYKKNPVAAAAGLTPQVTFTASAANAQIYGVKLSGVSAGGTLDNGTVHIDSLHLTTLGTNNKTALKIKAADDTGGTLSQLMTFYWLNRAVEYISARTGVLQSQGKNIRVVIDDTITGWSPAGNSIHLPAATSGASPMAWSAELPIHFLGLATLHYASDGAIDQPSSDKHKACLLKPFGCCSAAAGCSRAIESGVGDYFVAMMFPNQPTVGETWSGVATGMSQCGQSRNLAQASGITAQAAYQVCDSAGRDGDVSAMGTVYASIWWQVRVKAASSFPQGAMEIDTLFMNHLYDLDGTDDFNTARAKIRALDTRGFSGKHIPLFEAEFTARGL